MSKLKLFCLALLSLIVLATVGFAYLYFVVAPKPPRQIMGLETFFEPDGHCPDSPMTRLARIRLMVPGVALGPTSREILRMGEEVCRQKALLDMLKKQRHLSCRSNEAQFDCFKRVWATVQIKAPFSLSGVILMLKDGVTIINSSNVDATEKQFQMAELSITLMEFTHALAFDLTQARYAAAKTSDPNLYKEAALLDYFNRTVRLKTLYRTHAEVESLIKKLESAAQGQSQSRLDELKLRSRKIAENYDSFTLTYNAADQKLKFELKQTLPDLKVPDIKD